MDIKEFVVKRYTDDKVKGFFVETYLEEDIDTKDICVEFYLGHDSYSVKKHCLSILKENMKKSDLTEKQVVDTILFGDENYLVSYYETYMDYDEELERLLK